MRGTRTTCLLALSSVIALWWGLGAPSVGAGCRIPGADPTELAFVSDRDGDPEIFRASEDGSQLVQLTSNGSIDSAPAWSPDGRWIAFETNRDGDFEIYVMGVDGTAARNLSQSPGSFDAQPTWSPDGRSVAFHTDRDGDFEIYVLDISTGRSRNVTNHHPGVGAALHPTRAGADVKPSWGPSGRIAFESYRDPTTPFPDIWTVASDGSGAAPVTSTPGASEWFPDWSPLGPIAFMSSAHHTWDIWTSDPDGSDSRPVLSTWKSEFVPAWSPDGTRIAFGSTMADGGRDVQLGSVGLGLPGDPGEEVDHDLYVVSSDGTCLTRIVGGPATDTDPSYRPRPPT